MGKKYELTDETMNFWGTTLYRIKCVNTFDIINGRTVHKGDLGGWVQCEENLSQHEACWLFDDAKVGGHAIVSENAVLYDRACVMNNAKVRGNAQLHNNSDVRGNAHVFGNCRLSDNVELDDDVWVHGNSFIRNSVAIYGNANVCNAIISMAASIHDNAYIHDADIACCADIGYNAEITNTKDIFVVGPIGSRDGQTTFYRGSNNTIMVSCGCFNGTIQEFKRKVRETHKFNRYAKEYMAAIKCAKIALK